MVFVCLRKCEWMLLRYDDMCLVLLCLSNVIALIMFSLVNDGELTSMCVLEGNSMFKLDLDGVVVSDTTITSTLQTQLVDGNNIAFGEHYYVQTTFDGEEFILIFKLLEETISDGQSTFKLELVYNNRYSTISQENLDLILETKPIFYRVAANNIVLDGQSGDIYTFDYFLENGGYRFNGNGSINGREATFGSTSTITINDNGIEMKVNGEDGGVFSVDTDGTVTVNKLVITGSEGNNLLSGSLFIGKDSNGITLDGTTESIYSKTYETSAGADGWKIGNNGVAVFNDVTVRGRIESSTFIQNEIQALSGTLIIRPTLTFVDDSILNYLDGVYVGYVNEEPGIIDADYYQVTVDTTPFYFLLKGKTELTDGTYEIRLQQVRSTEAIPEELYDKIIKSPLINVGNSSQKVIGISLNATGHSDTFGFADSITIYDQSAVVGEGSEVSFSRNNRLIMGRLPSESFIPIDMQDSFGLYADNVYLKGAMVSAYEFDGQEITSGVNTAEINGNVFWAGALGSSAEAIAAAPFRITNEGFLYAKEGVFEGEIRSARIYTAELIGRDEGASLRIMNNPNGEAQITFEQYDAASGDYNVTARLNAQKFDIGMPIMVYDSNEFDSVPVMMSSQQNAALGVNKIFAYNFENPVDGNGDYKTSGWVIEKEDIYFKEVINDEEVEGIRNNYLGRLDDALNNTLVETKQFEISYDEFGILRLKNMDKVQIKENSVSLYNNLILSRFDDSVHCSFKLYTEYDSAVKNEVVKGYDLFIEES